MPDDTDDDFDKWAIELNNEAYAQLELREHFAADLMELRGEEPFDIFVRRTRANNARINRILARDETIYRDEKE
jgi:hypothetical protein